MRFPPASLVSLLAGQGPPTTASQGKARGLFGYPSQSEISPAEAQVVFFESLHS